MAASHRAATSAFCTNLHPLLFLATLGVAATLVASAPARAQKQQSVPEARVIVAGEGSVAVRPDYALIRAGVRSRAKTAKEATDASSKLMSAVTAALVDSGIAQNDIQTAGFSLQPVYLSLSSTTEPKLSGFSVSNQVNVKIRQIAKVGDVIDRLIAAGATDVSNVELLISEPSKAADQARGAALADARRKAELYAQTAGLTLGAVAWIAEESASAPPMPMGAMRASAVPPTTVPVAAGEDTLHVRVTVGFDIAR
ncbi:MAG TPA: SIMPL domain-containing protein [Xanthobacteraceae bacterium]|jgi:hypothetical protein